MDRLFYARDEIFYKKVASLEKSRYLCSMTKQNYSRKWIEQRRKDLLFRRSDAEKAAHRILSDMGLRVIPQQPIETGRRIYFADLYLPALKTIVEIDGGYHTTDGQRRNDRNRSAGIWRLGYHVLRLSNHDARSEDAIKAKLSVLTR